MVISWAGAWDGKTKQQRLMAPRRGGGMLMVWLWLGEAPHKCHLVIWLDRTGSGRRSLQPARWRQWHSHYYHYSASTAPQSRYLWCTMGCARLAGHGRVHPHQLATHVTGYMVTWLHRHGGTLAYKGLVMADTAQLGHPPDVTFFLLMGEAKNIRLPKVFILERIQRLSITMHSFFTLTCVWTVHYTPIQRNPGLISLTGWSPGLEARVCHLHVHGAVAAVAEVAVTQNWIVCHWPGWLIGPCWPGLGCVFALLLASVRLRWLTR